MLDYLAAIQDFSDNCIRCGLCAQTDCGNYTQGTCLGDICDSLLQGDGEFEHFPFTCALCNRCTADCPVDLKCIDCIKPARAKLLGEKPEMRANYRHFRTDLKHNMFSLIQGMDKGDIANAPLVEGELTGDELSDRTAFFPGCSIETYSPEMSNATFNWLREQGQASRKINFCCGATFFDTGFFEEYESFREKAVAFFKSKGITRLITVCPHCGYELPQLVEGNDIELVRLPDLMLEASVKIPGSGSYSVHDSCYDRTELKYGTAVRAMFSNWEEHPMEHTAKHTMCCGGGGMVSAYAPAFCEYRRNQRLEEADAVESDVMISTCFSCVNSMQRGAGTKPVKHYLELFFDLDIDWGQVYGKVDAMYRAPETSDLLAGDTSIF